jgi:4-diphosphocytidyl-2-C-methyl-D-erythritol kinase
MSTSEPITERAHAKLNVFLRVLARRPDGYHDLQSLVLPLELHDLVTVEPAEATRVEVSGPLAEELSRVGGATLVDRALHVFGRATGLIDPLRIALDKRIPITAGMGGGSADAAAVLRALGRRHAVSAADLLEMALEVGSDVPALVHGGPVFVEGRGERLTPVHAVTTTWVVRTFPFPVTTPDAFAWWDETPTSGPDPGALIAALETGNDELLGSALFDDLQAVVAQRHPTIEEAVQAFLDADALGAVMTGSGPTVVALARHLGHADAIARSMPDASVTSGPPRG